MSTAYLEQFTRETQQSCVVTGRRILITSELAGLKSNRGGCDVCGGWGGVRWSERSLHFKTKTLRHSRIINFFCWAALKGWSISGLKMPTHIRFQSLIFLVSTPNMFLYLSHVTPGWYIRLSARLWLYLIITLSKTEGLWALSEVAGALELEFPWFGGIKDFSCNGCAD